MVGLTDGQYSALAADACVMADGDVSSVALKLDCGDTFHVTFKAIVKGHYDEYGDWVTTYADCVVIDYARAVWVDDDTMDDVAFDSDRFERMVEKALITI